VGGDRVSVNRVMRMSNSPKIGKSVAKIFAAVLLAGAATGCSSDATRFGSLFGSSTDPMTTASINSNDAGNYSQAPVPRGDIAGQYGNAAQSGQQNTYPQANNSNYGGYNGVQPSPARAASSVSVQRTELAAPGASQMQDAQTRREAMAQPMPNTAQAGAINPDNITTGSVRAMDNGWHTDGAASVRLAQGESIAVLSSRYGVPEKALLQANGLTSSSQARAGQQIIIPRFGQVRNAARVAGSATDLTRNSDLPTPSREPEQKVAVLPTQNALRDKAASEAGKLVPPNGKGLPPVGGYKVKSGDSLAKIARENGVSVASLKSANGLTTENIRIGQTLVMPNASPAADPIQTASVQPKVAATAPAATQPQTQAAAPAKPDVSLSDIETKTDTASIAPQSTGISKYRWPVRGAVINNFGDNVDGTRNDGINISVPEGTPIKAAENGVVIYSGNGLKQLGNTVLVRHDDGRVTVYGNASKLEVQRGQKVQRGQTVAVSGMSGNARRPQVHFEVRKDATPVNPSSFLE
jgi:murein DD-endopeptidase MepM/ murein hydrolase activator NlpD